MIRKMMINNQTAAQSESSFHLVTQNCMGGLRGWDCGAILAAAKEGRWARAGLARKGGVGSMPQTIAVYQEIY